MSEPLPPGFVLDPVGSRTTGLRGPEAGWEVHADYGMRHSYNARVPFSRERIAPGPVTYDDGTMRIYASPDDEPALANRLQDIDRASRFDAHGLDSAEVGSLEAVSGFMFEEMKKNYRSDEVRKIAKLNASRIGTGKALMEWTALVQPGGVWDHKPLLKDGANLTRQPNPFTGRRADWFGNVTSRYGYDVWSNVHFGFVGRKAGFSEKVLMHGAGLAQLGTLAPGVVAGRISLDELGAAWDRAIVQRNGLQGVDDPTDGAAVKLGSHLYDKYGDRMTLSEFRRELASWPGLNALHTPVKVEQYFEMPPEPGMHR